MPERWFLGTSISLFGEDYSVNLNVSTSANYTVDDQDPINFLLPLHPNGVVTNQKLFKTGQLPLGQHKLVIVYLGNFTTVPLFFNYFIQQVGPSSTSSNIPSSTSSNIPSSTSSNTPTSISIPSGTSSSNSSPSSSNTNYFIQQVGPSSTSSNTPTSTSVPSGTSPSDSSPSSSNTNHRGCHWWRYRRDRPYFASTSPVLLQS